MAVKKRVIWLNDEDWALLKDDAERNGCTPSRYIHHQVQRQSPIKNGLPVRGLVGSLAKAWETVETIVQNDPNFGAPRPAPKR